jgi:aspartate-semialdehyde dehydrogenase
LLEAEASTRTERRIMDQLDAIFGKTFPKPALNAVQVPVFHSHSFSMFVNVYASIAELSGHFAQNPAFVMNDASGPSPVSVVGSEKIHIDRLRPTGHAQGYALWMVADNLRIAASNAIQIAEHIMLAPALEA